MLKIFTKKKNNFLMFLLLVCSISCYAQAFQQQGNKLIGTGAIGNGRQGSAVCLSADGNTALVSGAGDNNNMGAVWVYTRTNGVWSQQGNKLVGTGYTESSSQGNSVYLSADGNKAIIGGPNDDYGYGAAWIFTRSNGVWTQQGNKIVGTGGIRDPSVGQSIAFGRSVSLSADGNTAVVAGINDNNAKGAVWIFTYANGVWSQQGNKLVATGTTGQAVVGYSVSISADGNTVVAGGMFDNNGQGGAWVFTRTTGVWTQQGGKLFGNSVIGQAYQGCSVALSSDGNTAFIGGYSDNGGIGAAWVFTRNAGVWSQQGNKIVGAGYMFGAYEGRTVSLSADGNTAVIGGDYDYSGLGAVWVFGRNNGVWTQTGNKLVGSGNIGNAGQGSSICISGDASTIIIGGLSDNSAKGAAWIFAKAVPLPIKFVKIDAIREYDHVNIKWEVADAKDNKRYVIMRSADGINFTDIGDIFSSGFTSYNFIDRAVVAGANFYKIRAVDANDKFVYSDVVKVLFGNSKSIVTIYPNPVISKKFTLDLVSEIRGIFKVSIYNLTGVNIYNTTFDHTGSSSNMKIVLPSFVSDGMYQLKVISSDNVIFSKAFVINNMK